MKIKLGYSIISEIVNSIYQDEMDVEGIYIDDLIEHLDANKDDAFEFEVVGIE